MLRNAFKNCVAFCSFFRHIYTHQDDIQGTYQVFIEAHTYIYSEGSIILGIIFINFAIKHISISIILKAPSIFFLLNIYQINIKNKQTKM